ncbi:MAG: bifunctional diguanylate cyclase/phosphodiesterase [Bacillota bacterium]|nr:bifunctional diguanylate cyclase/phosphodiesterase [Bacillota bacterium]
MRFVLIGAALLLSIAGYLISSLLGNQNYSNLISPMVSLSTAVVIYLNLKQVNVFKLSWIFIGLTALTWSISDLIWMWMANYTSMDPDDSVLLLYAYLLPNIMLMLAGLSYFFTNMRKWHRFQLLVDASAVFLTVLLVLWNSLIDHFDFQTMEIHELITTISYVLTDAVALAVMVILITSARVNKISTTMKIVIAGYFGYILTDFYYIYIYTIGEYQPNEAIDIFYILSIGLFGIATLYDIHKPNLIQNPAFVKEPQNTGNSYRLLIFMGVPIVMVFVGILEFSVLLLLMIIMMLYEFVSGYIQLFIRNENLLEKERLLNEKLEAIIETRTNALRKANEKLEKSADLDPLTGMSNRRFFINKLDEFIAGERFEFSIYYMDLDHFKIINDIHGHDMGDRVLKALAVRFNAWQTPDRIVARIGGDEFALIHIQRDEDSKKESSEICKQLMQLFNERIFIDNYVFEVGVSIGIARYPYDSQDREILVKYADLAMYQAKKAQIDYKCMYYSAQHGAYVERRNRIELLLKTIDFDKEFELHYQPQFNSEGTHVLGVEALLRWTSPEMGSVSPVEFIQIAEETDNIIKIGKWVIDKAFGQIAHWNNSYGLNLKIGINLSPLQFDSIDFFPYIQIKLLEHSVDPAWIDFEITENSAMNSGTLMEETFTALSGLGVQISIDDFGTGYSSLSYIKRFDIDQLKIAKELIEHIVENSEERLIIKAIILMAKGMGLLTIAEGVETEEQLNILRTLGCDAIQGYYFSRPLPKEVFEERYLVG